MKSTLPACVCVGRAMGTQKIPARGNMDVSYSEIIVRAEDALNSGNTRKTMALLRPLIEKGVPAALFLYSHFCISTSETDSEFDERRIGILHVLNDLGYAPGIYELGVCYETGDLVEVDKNIAAALYKKAAELGYPKGKLSHGLDLYHGSGGIKKSRALGLKFIRLAMDDNVEGAEVEWHRLKGTRT
ncbi:tetratricopeptide repeat protein [Burkholderia pseudomultivorans]|nr:SEL1-like repeat protein [Burkholderia pseudomultivorans]